MPASQLFFSWNESEVQDQTPSEPIARAPSSAAATLPSQSSCEGRLTDREFAWPASELRLGREVKIGGIMIKLLKRYGITDSEIQEGLDRYAQRNCTQIAS